MSTSSRTALRPPPRGEKKVCTDPILNGITRLGPTVGRWDAPKPRSVNIRSNSSLKRRAISRELMVRALLLWW
ncbi:hypothetical protein D3C72_2283950 [compost metagenome]